MATFYVYQSTEDVEKFRKYRESIEDHFDSAVLAGQYLDGLIDWDGNPICDIHGSKPCDCFDTY